MTEVAGYSIDELVDGQCRVRVQFYAEEPLSWWQFWRARETYARTVGYAETYISAKKLMREHASQQPKEIVLATTYFGSDTMPDTCCYV